MNSFRRLRFIVTTAARQRGAIGIVAMMFILIVALFAMSQAATISSSNTSDSTRQADSVEALFIAESAIEHIGYRFVNSSPLTCSDATVGVGDAPAPIGRGTFAVLATSTKKFDGTTDLGSNECRVRVQGRITTSGVTRTIETIVSREVDIIAISSLNPNFNETPFDGTRADDDELVNRPVSWETLTATVTSTGSMAFVPYDQNGGNSAINTTCKTDATALNCDRSAFIRKTDTGLGLASAGGGFNTTGTPIVITIPSGTTSKTLRLTFDYRVWTKGGSQQEFFFSPRLVFAPGEVVVGEATGASGGDCAATSATGWCESGNTLGSSQPAYKGFMGKGCGYIDTPCFESGPADATLCPSYNPDTSYNGAFGTTGSGGTYAECFTAEGHNPPKGTTGYQSGFLTYVIPCNGTCLSTRTVTLQGISFVRADSSSGFKTKSGSLTWAWIDNLRLSVPALAGGGPSKLWREVAAP